MLIEPNKKTNVLQIDPIKQILMDFYSYLHQENPEGKTELVDYHLWAEKIKELLKLDEK